MFKKVKKEGKIEDIKYSRFVEEAKAFGEYLLNLELSNNRVAFIVNIGNATGEDVRKLIIYTQEKIKELYDVDLKLEQEFVNWE